MPRPDKSMQWWLRSKRAHLMTATLAFALPVTIVFAMELHSKGALTVGNMAILLALTIPFGLLAAIGIWETWFKKKRM